MESPGWLVLGFFYVNYYSFDFVVVYVLVSLFSEELNFNYNWSNKAVCLDNDFQLCAVGKTAQNVKLSLSKSTNILNIFKYYKLQYS